MWQQREHERYVQSLPSLVSKPFASCKGKPNEKEEQKSNTTTYTVNGREQRHIGPGNSCCAHKNIDCVLGIQIGRTFIAFVGGHFVVVRHSTGHERMCVCVGAAYILIRRSTPLHPMSQCSVRFVRTLLA